MTGIFIGKLLQPLINIIHVTANLKFFMVLVLGKHCKVQVGSHELPLSL